MTGIGCFNTFGSSNSTDTDVCIIAAGAAAVIIGITVILPQVGSAVAQFGAPLAAPPAVPPPAAPPAVPPPPAGTPAAAPGMMTPAMASPAEGAGATNPVIAGAAGDATFALG